MKIKHLLLLLILLSFVLAACQTNAPPVETGEESQTSVLPETQTGEETTVFDEVKTEQPTDTLPSDENESAEESLPAETKPHEYERGEWPNVCSVDFASDFIYTFDYYFNVNETTSDFLLGFTFNPDHYQGKDDYKIEAFADDPSIVEIVLVDKDALMDFEPIGGLTIKCLKTGTTRIGVTMTYLPTGGTFTTYATVTVVDPAATQPAETID